MASYMPQDDDIFYEDGEDDIIFRKEWSQIRTARMKEGYRDGATAGQDDTLQEGFNLGFRESITQAFEIAKLKGKMSALLAYHIHQQGKFLTKDAKSQLQELLLDISQVQESCLKSGKGGSYANYFAPQADGDGISKITQIQGLAEGLGLLQTDKADWKEGSTPDINSTEEKNTQGNSEKNVCIQTSSECSHGDERSVDGKEVKTRGQGDLADLHELEDLHDADNVKGAFGGDYSTEIPTEKNKESWKSNISDGSENQDFSLPVVVGSREATLEGQGTMLTPNHIKRFRSVNCKYEELVASLNMQYLFK